MKVSRLKVIQASHINPFSATILVLKISEFKPKTISVCVHGNTNRVQQVDYIEAYPLIPSSKTLLVRVRTEDYSLSTGTAYERNGLLCLNPYTLFYFVLVN